MLEVSALHVLHLRSTIYFVGFIITEKVVGLQLCTCRSLTQTITFTMAVIITLTFSTKMLPSLTSSPLFSTCVAYSWTSRWILVKNQ